MHPVRMKHLAFVGQLSWAPSSSAQNGTAVAAATASCGTCAGNAATLPTTLVPNAASTVSNRVRSRARLAVVKTSALAAPSSASVSLMFLTAPTPQETRRLGRVTWVPCVLSRSAVKTC